MIYERKCPWCGEMFTTEHPGKKYCSWDCSYEVNAERAAHRYYGKKFVVEDHLIKTTEVIQKNEYTNNLKEWRECKNVNTAASTA